MTTSTQVTVIPAGLQLPAHLQTVDTAALIAATNAAAAAGIKTGGFPRISIKGGKFHIVDGGETTPLLNPPTAPGQPALPMMLLEAVIVDANPAIVKTYYPGDFKDGDDSEPTCSSDNGVVPDSHIAVPQNSVCATCPKNQWGSKISKASGKEVKACSDSKRLAILPAGDLNYKALGLSITPAALTDWGKYVKALTDRSIPVAAVVTNITFDHTASFPKLQFAFGRLLEPAEFAKVRERAKGDDIRTIVTIMRAPVAAPLALPAPAQLAVASAAPAEADKAHPSGTPPPVVTATPVIPAFITTPTATPPPVVEPEKPKRVRRTRAQIAADEAAKQGTLPGVVGSLGHLPLAIRSAVEAVGANSPAGQAILAQYPQPTAAQVPAQPVSGAPSPVQHPEPAPAAAPIVGFGAAPVVTPPVTQAAQSAAMSLKEALQKKLGIKV